MRASRPVTRSGGSVLKAPVSIVVGAPQRGHTPSSGGGRVKRGLRPQGAPAPQRGHSPACGNRRVPLPQTVHPCILRYERPRVARPRSSGGGHAKRGLRPQGAPAPQRGHSPAWRDSKSCANTPTRASCTADTKIPVSNPKREKIRGSISS